MCIKNKMTIRPFVLGFVLLISKKIRVEIMRRGGLIMNDILKRFCWLDDKMTAGIVRRSFYRLGVILAFCDRARRSRRACSRASSRPPRGPALLARLPPRRRRCRRRCCSPVRQAPMIPPVWGDRIFEKCGIRRDEGGDGGKTLEIRGKRRLSSRDGGANYQQS